MSRKFISNVSSDNFLAKVGLLLCQWDQLRTHLGPDGLHHGLDLLRDVVMVAQHLVEDERPFVKVKEDVVTHVVEDKEGC